MAPLFKQILWRGFWVAVVLALFGFGLSWVYDEMLFKDPQNPPPDVGALWKGPIVFGAAGFLLLAGLEIVNWLRTRGRERRDSLQTGQGGPGPAS